MGLKHPNSSVADRLGSVLPGILKGRGIQEATPGRGGRDRSRMNQPSEGKSPLEIRLG